MYMYQRHCRRENLQRNKDRRLRVLPEGRCTDLVYTIFVLTPSARAGRVCSRTADVTESPFQFRWIVAGATWELTFVRAFLAESAVFEIRKLSLSLSLSLSHGKHAAATLVACCLSQNLASHPRFGGSSGCRAGITDLDLSLSLSLSLLMTRTE